jgi:tRNA threonylcarbamoyl adenosine modification protein (Sua5/YciO/YrdC/YwlC family)
MTQYFQIHPHNPQRRLIGQAVAVMRAGGVVAYPTDSSYALGCHLGDKAAMERIRRIRQADKNHDFTLVCRDLSEIATYARVDNAIYRLLKARTPGPYTFILQATREVPRRLQNPKRKSIGIRIPAHPITQALLEELGEPIMSSTLWLPGDPRPLVDGEEIRERMPRELDAIIDGGNCGIEATTVLEFVDDQVRVQRLGKGSVDFLGAEGMAHV